MEKQMEILSQIEEIKAKIAEHEGKAQEYREILKKIREATAAPLPTERPFLAEGTLEDKLADILSDEIPRTTRQLLDAYNKRYKADMKMTDFSSRLYGIGNKEKPMVVYGKVEGKGNVCGLPEWFNGSKLKTNYIDKIM